jgi:CHASE3 domain sensor protein
MPDETSFHARLRRFSRSEAARFLSLQLLVATTVLLVAALILMSMTLSSLRSTRTEEAAAQDTLLEITTVESRLMDTDGALSGYALSGNPWYRTRLKDDHDELHGALAKLGQSLKHDAVQLRRYQAIIGLAEKNDRLTAYLAAPEHRDEIARSPTAGAARIVTDDIRGRLWQVLDTERNKRKLNHAVMIEQAENSYWIAVGIVLLTFVFGALCTLLALGRRER